MPILRGLGGDTEVSQEEYDRIKQKFDVQVEVWSTLRKAYPDARQCSVEILAADGSKIDSFIFGAFGL